MKAIITLAIVLLFSVPAMAEDRTEEFLLRRASQLLTEVVRLRKELAKKESLCQPCQPCCPCEPCQPCSSCVDYSAIVEEARKALEKK